ncbi:MAG: ATP-binding protein [Candidatus Gastranaerophilales bacterium]|nr:ATP-binding protein [Candidatus Gastranaerophilales bacterium]
MLKNRLFLRIKRIWGEFSAFAKSGERRLSFEFAFLTSLVIVLIILCMGWYINAAMNALNEKAKLQNEILNVSISATVFNMIEKDVAANDYSRITPKIQHMLSNKILAYLVVYNNKTKKVLYSSMPKDSMKINNGILMPMFNADPLMKETKYLKGGRGDCTIYAGFYNDSLFKPYFDLLINQLSWLMVAAILMGLLLAYFLSRKIISPLNSLIQATSEFEQGDLSNRVDKTPYVEINELVLSYNLMADALQRLYSSLEHKVQERTKQLEGAYSELQSTQAMMVHSEKMKSLGELVAGIMHEINNPINFIYGNLSHLTNYSKDLIEIIDAYSDKESEMTPESAKAIDDLKQQIDYEFLKSDLPDLIRSCKEGTERTRNIILDLKNFSRMEELALSDIDLTKEIDTTLNILYNKFKHKITVHKEYEDNLPKVEAYGGQLNQVFMNILDNAAYAIDDKDKGDVWIRLKAIDKDVIIEIEDNGKGMSPDTMHKMFDPFFTTKPVGKGTGLGMSISYKVIKNHKGNIDVSSEVGKGTKFIITLPIDQPKDSVDENSGNESEFEIIE